MKRSLYAQRERDRNFRRLENVSHFLARADRQLPFTRLGILKTGELIYADYPVALLRVRRAIARLTSQLPG